MEQEIKTYLKKENILLKSQLFQLELDELFEVEKTSFEYKRRFIRHNKLHRNLKNFQLNKKTSLEIKQLLFENLTIIKNISQHYA
jgi:hypothetical protein